MHPKKTKLIDPTQAWFWTKEWQEGEREAKEDIRAGRTEKHKDIEAFFRCLDRIRK